MVTLFNCCSPEGTKKIARHWDTRHFRFM